LWTETVLKSDYSSLINGSRTEVAIIGGGIAGLMAAYWLKQAGKKVAVIEGRRIGQGTTGKTTAHITQAHGIIYNELINNFGQEGAGIYARANQEGIELIEKIIKREKIEADFKRVSEYIFASDEKDNHKIENEYEGTLKLGLKTKLLKAAPLPFLTGNAIEYPNQARFHPLRFLTQLAQIVEGNGVQIYENTRVVDVKEGEPMEVDTSQGKIYANQVVVATLYPILDRGGYFSRLEVYSSYVIAAQVEGNFPDAMFDSSEDSSHYFRIQPNLNSYLVLIGGEGHPTGMISQTQKRYQILEEYARERLKIKSIEYRWSTHDTYPTDNVPFIGQYLPTGKNLYVITGFKGYGMAHGAIGGQIIADVIGGKTSAESQFFDPGRINLKAAAKSTLELGAKSIKQLVKSKLGKVPEAQDIKLKPGQWKIGQWQGRKVAMFKNEEGKVSVVEASCRHMGCDVKLNRAEQTWDCPCHGSTYTLEGQVISGPTVKNLKKIAPEALEE
jgi:glycine/D-amino acid oxidase-like deaminating enzyme/nitrite reductase/ring-hydroxylating ferredoxin subunit